MPDVTNRDQVYKLVCDFYDKIRANDLLGPIFNKHIAEGEWPEHLSKLTDFWEGNLFGIAKFRGRPGQKHIMMDRGQNHTISAQHFETWLSLWFTTVDELYEGEKAERAKNIALSIGQRQFQMILNARP